MSYYELYGILFKEFTQETALSTIAEALVTKKSITVFTPNLEMLAKSVKDEQIKELLKKADILLPDGIGVRLCANRLGLHRQPRITGIDTAYALLEIAAKNKNTVFFLGGKPDIAREAAEQLSQKIEGLSVCGHHHGYFDVAAESEENRQVLNKINAQCPQILFVCMGFPRQEKWIIENAALLPSVKIFMGLGGSFDVWSGKIRRAPKFFRTARLEWLWRCTLEPQRIPKLISSARIFFIPSSSR